jgi:hypothetical protein
MKPITIALLCVMGWQAQSGLAAETKLPHDVYSGYFVSNKFEPKAAE